MNKPFILAFTLFSLSLLVALATSPLWGLYYLLSLVITLLLVLHLFDEEI